MVSCYSDRLRPSSIWVLLVLADHHWLHLISYALRCIAEVLEDGLEKLQARTAWHPKKSEKK